MSVDIESLRIESTPETAEQLRIIGAKFRADFEDKAKLHGLDRHKKFMDSMIKPYDLLGYQSQIEKELNRVDAMAKAHMPTEFKLLPTWLGALDDELRRADELKQSVDDAIKPWDVRQHIPLGAHYSPPKPHRAVPINRLVPDVLRVETQKQRDEREINIRVEVERRLALANAPAQIKPLVDSVAVGDVVTEPASTVTNEFKFSGLLKKPKTMDDWFEVIDEMTKEFYINNQNTMPSKKQARAALWKDSPIHGITVDGDDLRIIGVTKSFNTRSFNRRWDEYTRKTKPN